MTQSVFQPPDDEARALARALLHDATHAALATLQLQSSLPTVTRVAMAVAEDKRPMSLISSLAGHTRALEVNSACALLIGDPGDKGDPLSHPRLTLHCKARLIARNTAQHLELREQYLEQRPKAKLYAEFADFRFVLFDVTNGLLNAGFGKAYLLRESDL